MFARYKSGTKSHQKGRSKTFKYQEAAVALPFACHKGINLRQWINLPSLHFRDLVIQVFLGVGERLAVGVTLGTPCIDRYIHEIFLGERKAAPSPSSPMHILTCNQTADNLAREVRRIEKTLITIRSNHFYGSQICASAYTRMSFRVNPMSTGRFQLEPTLFSADYQYFMSH